MGKKNIKLSSILLAALLGAQGHADIPIGLVGGEQSGAGSSDYAAFVFSQTLDLTPFSNAPIHTIITTVSVNSSGQGLIGGQTASSIPYAATVIPNQATPLTLPILGGDINGVAINESGFGLIGGVDNFSHGYAAYVLPDGTLNSPLSISPASRIDSVALNNSDVGLIGGEGNFNRNAYAAYVAPDGTVTQVANTPSMSGSRILSVAINATGEGIIGGYDFSVPSSYAAFVTIGGISPVVLSPLPGDFAVIQSVAINNAGAGLIGGFDDSSNAYAGYSDPTGAVITLFNSPFAGIIYSVALDDFGIGLIGGQNGSDFYAALVQPDGTLTPLFSTPAGGNIRSVSLNHTGLGLIGGETLLSTAYAAFVAPDGTLTELNAFGGLGIESVSLVGDEVFNLVTPNAIGPFGSIMYTQLSAHKALDNRFIEKNKVWKGRAPANALAVMRKKAFEGELASNEFSPDASDKDVVWGSPKRRSTPKKIEPVCKPNSIWFEPFGDLIYLQDQGSPIPNFTNEVGGALLGYDREGLNYLIGTSLGYAFNYVGYSNHLGHSKVQEEMASIYGAYYGEHVWAGIALWGGIYQVKTIRRTLVSTSTGKTHGWILDPHFELASPWAIDTAKLYYIEPFVAFDWINNWQKHYAESGTSGLNVNVPGIYNSLLQSEIGLRFYENFLLANGAFRLEEKLSYVNQAPFGDRSVGASFVSSAASFPVAIASSKVENLGAIQLLGCYVPNNTSYPYVGFSFQATAGSSYQSYFGSVFTGLDF